MKILQLSTLDNRGGASIVAWNLMKQLERNGIECEMIVRYKVSNSDKVHGLEFNFLQQRLGEIFNNDVDFGQCSRIINNKFYQQTDCVHCHNLHGPFVNLSLLEKISKKKPIVWTLHDMWAITGHCAHSFECKKYLIGCGRCLHLDTPPKVDRDTTAYLWWRKMNIYKKSNLNIVVPSRWLLKKLSGSILYNKPVEVIYNGIDTSVFKPGKKLSLRKKLKLPLDKKIMCFSANGGKDNFWKGGSYIDEVLKINSGKEIFFLNIGGDVFKTKDNIINTGYIEDKNLLAEYYSACDLFLFSSIAENFPLVILEAMACGLAVVSSDVGGVREVLEHRENGYLAKYNDVGDLANGVQKIINLGNNELIEMQLRNCNKIKESFSLDLMVNKYIKLYERLVC